MSVIRRLIHTFPTAVSAQFVELLKQHDPRAMIVLGYYFAVLKMADDVWYLRGRAEWEIKGITDKLPEAWKPYMAWPLKVLNNDTLEEGTQGTETGAKGETTSAEMQSSFDSPRVFDIAIMTPHQNGLCDTEIRSAVA